MSYKYFTTRYGKDTISKIDELRKEFPGCHFLGGMCKDARGIFAIRDMETKTYGERWQLDNGDTFFAPTVEALEKIAGSIDSYKTHYQERIKVDLMSGKSIQIYPASAIPKKVFFSKKVQTNENNPYDTSVDYGRVAYSLFDRTQKEEKIMLDDKEMVDFVKLALKYSYNIPEPLWDSLQLISFGDFDRIFSAAMGCDWDHLQEEVKKFNAASPQTTGAIAV